VSAEANDRDRLSRTLTFLLAGGQGERLYPLTRERAKPSVPFGGIYRIVDFTLSNCINSGLRQVFVLTQYRSSSLDHHIQSGWSILSQELGEFVFTLPPQHRLADNWYRGTADAILQNTFLLEEHRPERVLIVSGDHIYKMDYAKMIEAHCAKNAGLTIACIDVPLSEATSLGVIEADADNKIVGFEEKPEHPRPSPADPNSALASMGVYIFDTDVLVRAISEDAKRDTAHDFGKNIIPDLVSTGRVYAHNFSDSNRSSEVYWRDIGQLDAYWQCHMDLLDSNPPLDLHDSSWQIRSYHEPSPPAAFLSGESSGSTEDCIVGGGCRFEGCTLSRSVFSHNVVVDPGAHIEGTIVMERSHIGRDARIRNAIIDKDVVIPAGATIGYDPEKDRAQFKVTDGGIVVIPKGYVLQT
jgi:glucose-1-phosphate adenylyltransferase